MRTYRDLTKDEKEELSIFTSIKESWEIQYAIILVVGIIPACIGLPLITAMSITLIMVGSLLVFLSVIIIILVLSTIESDKKRLTIIFGKRSIGEGYFGISKSDLQKVKKKVVYEFEIEEKEKVVNNGKTNRKRKATRQDVGTEISGKV